MTLFLIILAYSCLIGGAGLINKDEYVNYDDLAGFTLACIAGFLLGVIL